MLGIMGDAQSQAPQYPFEESTLSAGLGDQLVRLLGQRQERSLLLSDLGALLPEDVRGAVKENGGGLRTWLQRNPHLFKISGLPGREKVTLVSSSSSSVLKPAPPGLAPPDHFVPEMDNEGALLQLRGLPYRASTSDVRKFLGTHERNLKGKDSVELLLKSDGRPSGFARVQFASPAAAQAARDDLHQRSMTPCGPTQEKSGRYVEAFLYSDRPGKLRFKKGSASLEKGVAQELGASASDAHSELPPAARAMPEQAMAEIRAHMTQLGHQELLLSMLGVALSPATRLYLRKGGSGVKQLLAQYPDEFAIVGEKGRERIIRASIVVGKQSGQLQNVSSDIQGAKVKLEVPHSPPQKTRPASVHHDTSSPVCNSPVASLEAKLDLFASPNMATFQPYASPARLSPNSHVMTNSLYGSPFSSPSSYTTHSQCRKLPSPPGFDTQIANGLGVTSMASLSLSGLPPDACEQDILIFFAQHGVVERVADEARVVEIISKTTAIAPGHAIVKMASHKDAEIACRALDMQCFGGRFLKVALSYLGDTGGSGGAAAVVEPPALDPSWQQLLRIIEGNTTAVF